MQAQTSHLAQGKSENRENRPIVRNQECVLLTLVKMSGRRRLLFGMRGSRGIAANLRHLGFDYSHSEPGVVVVAHLVAHQILAVQAGRI